jgi:hypothetical protein
MRPLLSTLILLTALPAPAQPDTAHWSMQGPLDAFTTDDLGNLYTVKGNELDLYDRTGAHRAHNSLLTFGSISRIDGFSSMKPMIFSRTQGQLAVLDNTLSVQGSPINLPAAGFSAISAACMGVQNRYWLYDEREAALVRVDAQLRPVARSGRLDQVLGVLPHPTWMEETDERLYLVDPDLGVFVFDLFGTPLRTLPITGARRVQVRSGAVWYVAQGALMRYDLLDLRTELVPWPAPSTGTEVVDARIAHGRLYRQCKDRILVDALPVEIR